MYYIIQQKELVSGSQHTGNIHGEVNQTNYLNL